MHLEEFDVYFVNVALVLSVKGGEGVARFR